MARDMTVALSGIDLAKNVFQLHGASVDGLDMSRFDAAPLIAFIAAKETDYGSKMIGRVPC
jgi:hypothetical protein